MRTRANYDSEYRFRATSRFVAAMSQAAQASELKVSEYVRQAVRAQLEKDGIQLVAGDQPQ